MTLRRRLMMNAGDGNALIIYTAANNTSTFDPSWVFSAGGGPMTVDWGDGSPKESHATVLSHTYAGAGTKKVKLTCPDWTKVTTLDINTDACKSPIPNVARLTNLKNVVCFTNSFSYLPSLAANTLLDSFQAYSNAFAGYESGGFATQKNLNSLLLHGAANILPVAFVDAILADLVTSLAISGRATCIVNLSGGNAAPSNPAGLASKAALVAAGWTVTTN